MNFKKSVKISIIFDFILQYQKDQRKNEIRIQINNVLMNLKINDE